MSATIPSSRLKRKYEKVLTLFANESRHYTQTDICRILKLPRYTTSRYTIRLVKEGLLEEIKLGRIKEYQLTIKGKTYCRYFFTGSSEGRVRSHNICFSCHILRKPRGWVFDNSWRVVPVRNWVKYIGDGFDGLRVEITPRRVLFYVGEIYSSSADEGMRVAVKLVEKAVNQLHVEFPCLVLGKLKRHFSVSKQHHGLVEHPLTVKFPRDFNVELNRVGYDHSRGVGELEVLDDVYGQDDAMKIMEFTDKLLLDEYDFEALRELPKAVSGLQEFVASGTTLMNMMYAHQKRVEGDVKRARKVRHYIEDKSQKKLSDFAKQKNGGDRGV